MLNATEAVPWLKPEAIEEAATRVREQHGARSVPVDPYDLATRMGISVYQARFEDESIAGALRSRDGEPEILVRSGDPTTRQAFTVAHEIGHFTLHWRSDSSDTEEKDGGVEFVDSDWELYRHGPRDPEAGPSEERDRQFREIQANMFAAALLMPEAMTRLEWKRHRSVKGLARLFEVSAEAMRYRIDQLGLW